MGLGTEKVKIAHLTGSFEPLPISHKMINLALLSWENITFFSTITFKSIILSVSVRTFFMMRCVFVMIFGAQFFNDNFNVV